jgi:exopolysaccharide biosynthesis polyprenyl glycosylphosphotransferase
MMRLRHKILIHAFRLSDQVFLWLALVLSVAFLGGRRGHDFIEDFAVDYHPMTDFIAVAGLALLWGLICSVTIRYNANRFTSLWHSVVAILKATTACSFVLLILASAFHVEMISANVVAGHWAGATAMIVGGRGVIRVMLKLFRRSGYNRRHVVFVGINERSLDFAQAISARAELGYQIRGFVNPAPGPTDADVAPLPTMTWPVVCSFADFRNYLASGVVDEVMVCLPVEERIREILQVFKMCQDQGVVIRFIPGDEGAAILQRAQVEDFNGEHVITFFRENLLWQLLAKRVLDFTVSASMLIVLAPLFLVVALAIKLTSPGPVFFSQLRVGMNKRIFKLYKFRSMVVDAEARKAELAALNEMQGPAFKIKNDPRVTKLGRFIRKTSIDELPQLWNVLKGEMSLVGPRPPLPKEVEQYEWLQRRRLSIKPGITCLWQIGGRNQLSFDQWMELDRYYCEHWSLWLDLKILLKTIPVVLLGKGAS